MKKIILLSCLLAQAAFSSPQEIHRTINLSDLPPALRLAKPHSYDTFLKIHKVKMKSSLAKQSASDYIFTNNALDIALVSPGYITALAPGKYVFTRFGQLALNGNGELVTRNGLPIINMEGPRNSTITLSDAILPPQPTTFAMITGNIKGASMHAAPIYDAQGNNRYVEIDFTPSAINKYSVVISDFQDHKVLASGAIYFKNGQLDKMEGLSSFILPSLDGSIDPTEVHVNGVLTNYSYLNDSLHVTTNGFRAGELVGLEFLKDGRLIMEYSNNVGVSVGRVAISQQAMQDLKPYGSYSNYWSRKFEIGYPLFDNKPEIISGYLEKSAIPNNQ